MADTKTFQPMPALSPEQYDALKTEIEQRGILVPAVVDQRGRILDGHNRMAIATELGITCPTETRIVADDDEAAELALTLNTARRHLTQEQKRDLIRAELIRRPHDSDRAIARRVGCSPTTVGTDRAEWRAEAEAHTVRTRELIDQTRDDLVMVAMMRHGQGQSWQTVGDVLERLIWGQWSEQDDGGWTREGIDFYADVFVPIYGEFFDGIRSVDCSEDCETCTPQDRKFRDEYPGQVYRHSEPPQVSNLDSATVGGDSR